MTQEQLDTLKLEIDAAVGAAGDIAKIIAPQFTALIVLGQLVAKTSPDLLQNVQNMISGKPPTEEEKTDLANKLTALANPETI